MYQVVTAKITARPTAHGTIPAGETPWIILNAVSPKTIATPLAADTRVRFKRFDVPRTVRPGRAVGKATRDQLAVRGACDTKAVFSGAVNKKADDRTQEERWAVLVQSAYALFSGAPHDDEGSSEHFTWTRADAVAAVATAAGLLARPEDLP